MHRQFRTDGEKGTSICRNSGSAKKSVRIEESRTKTPDRERSTPTALQTEFQPILQKFREMLL